MDESDRRAMVDWAHSYNGYHRLGGGGGMLGSVLQPLTDALQETGHVPDWAGVDLLRGMAFLLTRAAAHSEAAEDVLENETFWLVVEALRQHPHARPWDRPPM